jgi:hypothetical protein
MFVGEEILPSEIWILLLLRMKCREFVTKDMYRHLGKGGSAVDEMSFGPES